MHFAVHHLHHFTSVCSDTDTFVKEGIASHGTIKWFLLLHFLMIEAAIEDMSSDSAWNEILGSTKVHPS